MWTSRGLRILACVITSAANMHNLPMNRVHRECFHRAVPAELRKCRPLRRGCSSCGQAGFAQSEPISPYIAVGGHTAGTRNAY